MATWRYTESNTAELVAAAAAPGSNLSRETESLRRASEDVGGPLWNSETCHDLSYSDLDEIPEFLYENASDTSCLTLDHNLIQAVPSAIGLFLNLVSIELSNNRLKSIADEICCLVNLRTFTARNNCLTSQSIPKDFGTLPALSLLHVTGNLFEEVPMQFTELRQLKCLYMGANRITSIPREIRNLNRLEVLYLGGNRLTGIPDEVGCLTSLTSLVLCDNRLESLPRSLINLRSLQSLSLHNNRLATLPPEIIRLSLIELSLRNNPLVVRFVEEMTYEAPSLLELAGRVIKLKGIRYTTDDLPISLVEYLDSAHQCVNPKCRGVFFTSRVEHVKFVDFCGKYRLPLLQYLCSPRCTNMSPRRPSFEESSESDGETDQVALRMKKVLLG